MYLLVHRFVYRLRRDLGLSRAIGCGTKKGTGRLGDGGCYNIVNIHSHVVSESFTVARGIRAKDFLACGNVEYYFNNSQIIRLGGALGVKFSLRYKTKKCVADI